jgi:hypothetical protein
MRSVVVVHTQGIGLMRRNREAVSRRSDRV